MAKRIVIAGGTGFIGRALAPRLRERGDEVVILTRGRPGARDGVEHVTWDAATLGHWVEALDGADAIVHLTGKNVDARPTRRTITELVQSRVRPTRLVGEALRRVATPPPVWVQASTLAIYGNRGEELITESTPVPGDGPPQMVQVALAWERAFAEATQPVPRTVLLRMGVTIGDHDPATRRLALLARLGLGGRVGSGQQWLSWISLDDLLAGWLRAIDSPAMTGLYHLTCPTPVRNHEAMAAVRAAVGRTVGMPSPAWLTRLGAPVLGSDPMLALTGRRAIPQRLLDEGFPFRSLDFATAVQQAMTRHARW